MEGQQMLAHFHRLGQQGRRMGTVGHWRLEDDPAVEFRGRGSLSSQTAAWALQLLNPYCGTKSHHFTPHFIIYSYQLSGNLNISLLYQINLAF